MLRETILARGHENVTSANRTTFEITKEAHLSRQGNCIIAVSADKGLKELSHEFKEKLRSANATIIVQIEADEESDMISAFGNPLLTLTHQTDIVIRKSDFVSDRTLAIRADKAACDLSRKLVDKLRDPEQKVKITLTLQV